MSKSKRQATSPAGSPLVSKAPFRFMWHYWVHVPKTRKNSGNLLWLASAWNYKRNITVTQDSRLLLVFKITITISFILIIKWFFSGMTSSLLANHLQDIFKTPQDALKMSWRHFQDIAESKKLYILEGKKLFCSRCLQGLFKTCLEDVLETTKRLIACSVDVFFSKNLTLSMWIYYLVIHEIILWCLDLCSKALLRYLGQASETIYIALILHMLTYQNLWVTFLM